MSRKSRTRGKPWTRFDGPPLDCSPCDACATFTVNDLLEARDGFAFCPSCLDRTVAKLRRHRPADCVWFRLEGNEWKASRTRRKGATLVRTAAHRELIRRL